MTELTPGGSPICPTCKRWNCDGHPDLCSYTWTGPSGWTHVCGEPADHTERHGCRDPQCIGWCDLNVPQLAVADKPHDEDGKCWPAFRLSTYTERT